MGPGAEKVPPVYKYYLNNNEDTLTEEFDEEEFKMS